MKCSETRSEKIVTDTSALVEYFTGTASGKKVKHYVEGDYTIIVPSIVIAELSNIYRRKGKAQEWESRKKPYLKLETWIYPLESELADLGGEITCEKKKSHPNFSLADGIIMATAKHAEAQILTKDKHLLGKNSIII